jgi:hypothetical protein
MTSRQFLGNLLVFAGPAGSPPPFDLDAVVIEQDCDLVLEVETEMSIVEEPIESLVRAMASARPHEPGTVLVDHRSRPARIAALVHDFSADPPLRVAWVASSLDNLWRRADALGFAYVGLPLLGSVHGSLSAAQALQLTAQSLWRHWPAKLRALWLLMNSEETALLGRWRDIGRSIQIASPGRYRS